MVARARLCKGSTLRSDPAMRGLGLDRDSARASRLLWRPLNPIDAVQISACSSDCRHAAGERNRESVPLPGIERSYGVAYRRNAFARVPPWMVAVLAVVAAVAIWRTVP